MVAREESFPGTPRRCDPDRHCLRGLLFEPVDAEPGEVRLVATYENDDAEHDTEDERMAESESWPAAVDLSGGVVVCSAPGERELLLLLGRLDRELFRAAGDAAPAPLAGRKLDWHTGASLE